METVRVNEIKVNMIGKRDNFDLDIVEVVTNNYLMESNIQILRLDEIRGLVKLCSILLAEKRSSILSFVVDSVHSELVSNVSASEIELIRYGLNGLITYCHKNLQQPLWNVEEKKLKDIIGKILSGNLKFTNNPGSQASSLLKILDIAASAYYSHPIIWSEISEMNGGSTCH